MAKPVTLFQSSFQAYSRRSPAVTTSKCDSINPPSRGCRPFVLAMSLGDKLQQNLLRDVHRPLINCIADRSCLRRAKKIREALGYLKARRLPQSILITDPGIVQPRNQTVSKLLVEYVMNGGVVVLGGFFSSYVQPDELREYFRDIWGLSWEATDYYTTSISLNEERKLGFEAFLSTTYSTKALFLRNVEEKDVLYRYTEGALVETRDFWPCYVDPLECAIAYTNVGKGWLGYVGDLGCGEATQAAVLAMLGLRPWSIESAQML